MFFELLAGLALAAAPAATNPYRQDALNGFVAVENSRPFDGIDYSNGRGVFSAGLLYAHPRGFFAGTELLAGAGDGIGLPHGDALGLQTFAGLAYRAGGNRIAIELLDYRFDAQESGVMHHQGVGLRYARGQFQVELAQERDRPYYYHYLERFFPYDNQRFAVGWRQPFAGSFSWSLGAGISRIDRIDIDYRFFSGSLGWRHAGVDWQLGFSAATDELEMFYGTQLDRSQLLLRATLPFRVF